MGPPQPWSALTLKADFDGLAGHVAYGPEADILDSHDMNVFPTACCTRNRPSPSTLAERQLDHD
jgi:hypothetical protein